MNLQYLNQIVWLFIACLLTSHETCDAKDMFTYVVMYFHQWLQLVVVFAYPIAVMIMHFKGEAYHYGFDVALMIFIMYMLIQNHTPLINKDPSIYQTCVLSQYTNVRCGKKKSARMEDVREHVGLKKHKELEKDVTHAWTIMLLVLVSYKVVTRYGE